MTVSRETKQREMRRRLTNWLDVWSVEADEAVVGRLVEFAFMLSAYTEANVVGTRDLDQILERHIADSLSCLLHQPSHNARMLVDVGSGAGLPGLPLRMCLPRTSVTLIESTGKKTAFAEQIVDRFELADTHILNERAEGLGRNPEYREKFDLATARALASLPVVAEYCLPLVTVGGYVVAMKGRPTREELDQGARAAEVLGGKLEQVVDVPTLPETEVRSRCLVVLKKEAETPRRYPRRVGLPRQHPLGT